MRWVTFALLATVTVSLQVTLAGRWEWLGARPDWLIGLVLFYALHFPRRQAITAAWSIGALADMLSMDRFGLFALTYTVAAWFTCAVRDHLFTRHPLTQFSLTLVCALLSELLWTAYRAVLHLPAGPAGTAVLAAVYSACWAPFVHGLLLRMPGMVGLPRRGSRRGYTTGMRATPMRANRMRATRV